MTTITKSKTVALQTYRDLERRIAKSDLDALKARLEFGRNLLKERAANGGKKLPNRRLETLAAALSISEAEISNRMQFAEQYELKELPNALGNYGSWHEIVARGLGKRSAPKRDEFRELVSGIAKGVGEGLRQLRDDITPSTPSLKAQDLRDHLIQWKDGVAGMLAHAKNDVDGLWPMFDAAELSPEARGFFARWIAQIGERYIEFGEYLRTTAQQKEKEPT